MRIILLAFVLALFSAVFLGWGFPVRALNLVGSCDPNGFGQFLLPHIERPANLLEIADVFSPAGLSQKLNTRNYFKGDLIIAHQPFGSDNISNSPISFTAIGSIKSSIGQYELRMIEFFNGHSYEDASTRAWNQGPSVLELPRKAPTT